MYKKTDQIFHRRTTIASNKEVIQITTIKHADAISSRL
jgi:hypothetical protein